MAGLIHVGHIDRILVVAIVVDRGDEAIPRASRERGRPRIAMTVVVLVRIPHDCDSFVDRSIAIVVPLVAELGSAGTKKGIIVVAIGIEWRLRGIIRTGLDRVGTPIAGTIAVPVGVSENRHSLVDLTVAIIVPVVAVLR